MSIVPAIYVLSDSIGETGERVARATVSQFDGQHFEIIRVPYVSSVAQIEEALKAAAQRPSVICHTLVSAELREAVAQLANKNNIPVLDIMGPMIRAVQEITRLTPHQRPGLVHNLDRDYFQRIEAVEFAVKYDDGKSPRGLLKADIVLVGISRTSKTPLSMYLAHKKIKVANVPMVPEVPPPEELFKVPPERIIGLVIDSMKLNEIRTERLKTMGLACDANYANLRRISEELEYARGIMERLGCPVLDVSNKAIEETANKILEIIHNNRK